MTGIFESTMKELSKFIEHTLTNQEFVVRRGLLQSIDPRIKLITTISAIYIAIQSADVKIFTLLFLFTIILSSLSKINLTFYLKRIFIFTPLFSALVVVPYPFIFGTHIINTISIYTVTIKIYYEGVMKALIFTSRVTIIIAFSTLFILTTRWPTLLMGLKKLHLPSFFIALLDTTYRQITQFVNLLYRILITRESRMVSSIGTLDSIKYWSGAVGLLFIKAYEYAEKTTLAVNARGGNLREIIYLYEPEIRAVDISFLVLFCLAITGIMWYSGIVFTFITYTLELIENWLIKIQIL